MEGRWEISVQKKLRLTDLSSLEVRQGELFTL